MKTLNTDNPKLGFALKAVQQACELVQTVQAEMVTTALTKDDRSPVTVADFAAQALVAYLLDEHFPNDPLVGEEEASALEGDEKTLKVVSEYVTRFVSGSSAQKVLDWINRGNADPQESFWTLDPIDGTKGFLRGQQYAVALAWLAGGQVQLGVLGCPNLRGGYAQEVGGEGSLVVALRGQGTWTSSLNGGGRFEKLRVSEISEPAQARFLRSFEAGHTNVSQLDVIAEKMGAVGEPVRLDSQAKYAILASGHGDTLFRLLSPKIPNYREKIWDQAAGSLVVEEAGGKISDLDGKPLDFSQGRTLARNRGILASNGLLHDSALAAISAVGA